MKNLAFLEQADHTCKAAIYAAAHDGKLRNFAYHEELGECRETFSRLLQAMQEGEIGVILTPDAACLAVETSPGWMEAFIQVVKEHGVRIGDHSHDLVYDLREEEDEAQFRGLYSTDEYERERSASRPLPDATAQSSFAAAYIERGENWFLITRLEGQEADSPIYSLSSGARGQDVDMFGMGRWKELLDALAPYGISEQGGWCPVPPERRDWLPHTLRVILPGRGKVQGKKRRKRGGRTR